MATLFGMELPNRQMTEDEMYEAMEHVFETLPNIRKSWAAIDVAFGKKTNREISEMVHITERQLMRWKTEPDFIRKVQEIRMIHDLRLGITPQHTVGDFDDPPAKFLRGGKRRD